MKATDDFSVYRSLLSLCIPSHFLFCRTMGWKYCKYYKTKVIDTQCMLNLRGIFSPYHYTTYIMNFLVKMYCFSKFSVIIGHKPAVPRK